MRKLKRAIKRSSGVVLASAMIFNSSGVMTFAQTLELEKTITAIEESYGINSSKNTTTDGIAELSTDGATDNVEATQVTQQAVEQESEAVANEQQLDDNTSVEAVANEQQLDNITNIEAPDIVIANANTTIGDGLRTLLNSGTAVTGKVVDNEYQISVKKGQNIGFYSDSVDYRVSFGNIEYADYEVTGVNSFGTDYSYRSIEKSHYFILTALEDGTISISNDVKDSVEIKSVTSPALKHNTVEAEKSYELKLADSWENNVAIQSNQGNNWFEYASYDADGINVNYGSNNWYIPDLNKKDGKVTSTYEEDVDVIYPYEYDVTAVTFAESKAPALKHNKVEVGKSYELKLADSWGDNVAIQSNQGNNWFEYALYNADGINVNYGSNNWYIPDLNKKDGKVREVITSTYEEDVDVIYPYEYDVKAVTFAESKAPALSHQTIEAGKSYQIQLKEGQTINPTYRTDRLNVEYAVYGSNGYCSDYGDSSYSIPTLDVTDDKTKLVFTSKEKENKEITYPYEYGVNVMIFAESEAPALQRKTIQTGKSYEIKLVDNNINDFNLYHIDNAEYAMYGDDGACNGFGNYYSFYYGEFNRKENRTKLVITSKADSDYQIYIPYEYDDKVITFNESEKGAITDITFADNSNFKITNIGNHKVEPSYSKDFIMDVIDSANTTIFQSDYMPSINPVSEDGSSNNFVYVSTYNKDNTIRIPTDYNDNLQIEQIDEPIFNRIELKAGENIKLTSKAGVYSNIYMSGDNSSKISTLVMNPNQSGNLSSDIALKRLYLYGNQEMYIQASKNNATNVLVGIVYNDIKNEDVTVEKTDIDISEANKFENVTNVTVKEAKAVKADEEKVTYATALSDYKYTMYNETTKQYIYGYKYNTSGELSFSNGSVSDGDVISITLSSDKIDTITQEFTYEKNGSVELNVSQKGGYSITDATDMYNNVYLFDSEGKFVKSKITKDDINQDGISSGKYQLLVIRTNEAYVNQLTKLSDLDLYGLEKDKDYTLTDVEIKSGVISTFDVSKNVSLRDGKTLTSFDKTKTKVTASADTIIGNNKGTITVDYALNSKFNDWSLNTITVAIPYYVTVVQDSVKVDGSNVKYIYNNGRLVVNTTNKSGKITFEFQGQNSSLTGSNTRTFAVTANLTPTGSMQTVENTLGETSIKSYNFNFSTSNIITKNEAQLNGSTTVPEQDVEIFVDDKKVTTVKTDSNGAWNTKVTLPEKEVGETYKIYASLYTGTENEVKTEEKQITYNPISSTVKKFDLSYNSQSYNVLYYNNAGSKMNLTPGKSYKFTLGFGNTSVKDVYVVGTKDGVQKKIKATQDANGNWVAEGYFDDDTTFVPDIYNVTFTETEQKLEVIATASATTVKSGDTVKISTQLKNALGAYTYKFIAYDTTTKQWTKLQDFSSSSSYTWKTTDAGNKQVYVDVKDSKGNVTRSSAVNIKVTEDPSVKPLAISATKQESGNKITFTATGNGGSGKYSYKFLVYNKTTNSWAKLQDFSDKNTFTWTKGTAGDRYFYVDIKDNSTGKTVRSEALNVKIEETTKPLVISATKQESGNKITFTATGNGGSGKYSYKFLVYNKTTNSWAKLQDFSSKNTFTWTKGTAGDRYFYVDIKDNSTGKTVRSQALNVKIEGTSKPTSTLTASTANVNVGGKVTLTAKATAGSGKYTYKFLIYNPTTKQWAKLQDFSNNSTFTWTAGSAGARQFYVDVKDGNGKVTRSQVVNVQVGNAQSVTKLSVKATASTTANKVGQNVTFTATANGGAGGYTYKFLVYNKTTKQWAKIQDFSATSKLTWKAGSAGERQFYVDVKDKNGNTVRSSVMNVKTTK